ncbi:MAG TPA: M1 family metallopeptidase [Polyangiaceae bacterium]|nr:M1 family metallopeptidase [Polyangiaceae bacterium]
MRSMPLRYPLGALPALVLGAAGLALPACRPPSAQAPAAEVAHADPPGPDANPPSPREDGRLPATAVPQRYHVALTIDPTKPRFSGTTTIEIDLPQPTYSVVLNARDMTVSRAVARVGGVETAVTATPRLASGGVTPEELVLEFAKPLPAGPAVVEIAYDAPFASDLAGLYRVEEQGRWYAYTQFESTDARRAFPCFDEPGFKTPYEVTITAPAGMIALSNSPETQSVPASADGALLHTFAPSPPLPTYLVAFAVGDFDVAEGRKEPFPIRVITTKGRAHLASVALDVAAALIDKLGEYFDMRYPYAKLDLVAVPDFAAGAMENPGLVTFRDVLLLIDPLHATTSTRRAQAEVIAHEFAHQWFGDLVTMKWWNDIWLNEGFATWAEAKVVDQWKPNFGATMGQIANVEHVMDTDALRSARAVREPVRSTSDAMEAFDGITYQKGAAVLRMIESFLGPDVFQRGVQRYVHENAWKNASADDLFKALDFVSTQKVDELASGFLDHPGVPQVFSSYKCLGATGRLELRQSEWHPLGEPASPPESARDKRAWTLPVCVAVDGQKTRNCFTLGSEPIARDPGAHSCPAWIYPNANQAGYYRFLVERDKLFALAHAGRALDPTERLGLVSNAWAGVRQGAIAPSTLLDFLPLFDAETNRYVVEQVIDALRGVDQALVEEGARAAYEKYVGARLAGRKRALGWWPPSGHEELDDDLALERRSVLWALGELANDETTLAEADRYAGAWLRNRSNVAADTAAVAVPLASIGAGEARLVELREAARSSPTPDDRVIAIRAMGMFDDPVVLRKAFDLALGDELKLSEWRYLFGAAGGHRAARPVLYAWEKENWAKIRARAPNSLARGMVDVAGAMCTHADQDDAQAFFSGATQGMEGVKRPLDEALESAGLCVALREHGAQEVTQYLKKR